MTSTTDRASESDAALERYRRSLRRSRGIYAGVVTAIVVALVVVVAVAWSRGEVAHTALRTAPSAAPSLPVQAPSGTLQEAWHSDDRAAIGVSQWGGTVVTWSEHTVRGRDARTGATAWSYTRDNRTLCTAAQAGGTTLALYMVNGNCDELTALDSRTGVRRFTRTLDKDGMPVDGRPSFQVLSYTFLVTTPSVVYAIDPVSGYDRWTFQQQGCRVSGAVLGTAGALISQTCTKPVCSGLKFCGRGPQLLLRDGIAGRDDKSTTNPDKITWNQIGDTDLPVAADDVVAALNTSTRALDVIVAGTGKPRGTVSLDPTPSTYRAIQAVPASGSELVWIDGRTYLVDPARDTSTWSRVSSGPPSVVGGDAPTVSGRAGVTLAGATGIEQVATATGTPTQTFAVPSFGAQATAVPLGSGFLVSSASGTVAYR